MLETISGLDDLSRALQDLQREIDAGAVEATHAAGDELFQEIHLRAKGSVRENLTLSVHPSKTGVTATVQVQDSAPGGKEHHAIFLEYGTSKMAAEPFMRPGFDAAESRAVDRFTSTLAKSVKE